MRRRTFDILMAAAGLFLAVTLIAAGGLLTWAHTFIGNEVHTQLAAEKVYFPANNSPAIKAPEFAAMHQYAGQQLTTGAQAEVYADHFIAAVVMLVLGALGLMHARRTSATSNILDGHPRHASGPGTAPLQTTGSSGNGLGTTMPGSSAGRTA